ncbi:MAG: hypothetical protein KAW03_08205, partial [Candidatus Lokiarchaeota archaeon]|nr:hypothetical protein [Candidatus Lokiarchaeota archaeon]
FLLGIGPTAVLGERYHSDYEGASQKILTQIKSFTFSYDSTTLRYNIVFGARFIKTNDTSEFVSDVFVFTAGESYVTMLTAILTFDASFSYDGTWNNHSGSGYDSTSLFQYGDLLYSYGIHSFIITNDLFPLELEITFVYDFNSDEFSESGTYTVVKSFSLKSSGFKIPGYILSTTISILVVGILAVAMIYKRKKILKINNS